MYNHRFYRSIFIHPQIDNFDMWKFCAMHKLNSISQKLQTTAVACFLSTSLSPYFGWCSIGYSHGSVFGITHIITEKSPGIKKIILKDFSELAGKTFSVFTYVVCVLVLILMYS